ncbi:hypothetical protein [Pseudanabaena sp. FACHB-2040]|uniref:hypothetical protein n=1 Tax=Pseudanabaena sp. FACHB-2040 TaxID=2692859 RepID=UPI001686E0AF|nr:hypothetical protein [Pseudanabaena sp. FACHB-2040]MBD2261275.1 hypothetical protein [Pseudanabaena sp. FACHB-2040]
MVSTCDRNLDQLDGPLQHRKTNRRSNSNRTLSYPFFAIASQPETSIHTAPLLAENSPLRLRHSPIELNHSASTR